MKYTRITSLALLGLLLGTSACKKDFLDINTDPNNPTTADVNLVLPSGQAFVSFIVGGQYNVIGEILSQQMGIPNGGNQYRTWDQYNIPTSTFDGRQFQGLYAGALEDFQYVITQGTAQNEFRMVGIAKILKAHSFQVLTDLYGDIPYSEALMGTANLTPKYDRQQDVYAALQLLLDDAINDIKKQQGRFPGTADLNYGALNEAGMSRWIRLANTLKLRFYIHISTKDPATAAAGIKALYAANGTTNPFMLTGENYQYANTSASNSENPFYQTNFRLQNNLAVSSTIGNLMTTLNDPRRSVFFLDADLRIPTGQTTSPIDYLFVEPGQAAPYPNNYTFPGTTNAVVRLSYPGTFFIGSAFSNAGALGSTYAGITATDAAAKARPTLLLTYEESLFLRAEAAVQGWTTNEDAKALYDAAVTASLTRYGVGASAATYLASTGVNFANSASNADKLALIANQKYISFFATNGAEAWTENRRTDIPTIKSPLTNVLGPNVFVKRLPYVDSEILRNPKVADTGITPGNLTTPVWWDVK
ncbi:SusD/RagB family nutrient-binding outer membrane lipoprotein [Hymenobacter ruricola]|uniref:SusD/RagB family nutrient-binding outer membrane lipoprotein n=1 Tax=Hymenobacter ruricola TaxID=2791023 RepID=A0ABS0HZ77_9BACT|nr:SusD/RagB family nutrient-binding outer membrane lipoprotein [Hymenobacter ruricola]MBF9219999.1 SusD/RagB family nutrient-binding outer membrane lipoprotein [Hymenobacter ruricola]